jgi:hypothetical protein
MGYYSWNETDYVATIHLEAGEEEVVVSRTVTAESSEIALVVTAMHVGVVYPNHRVTSADVRRKYDD